MRRLLAVVAATAAALGLGAAPAVASERMNLDCGRTVGTIERTNGASWFGVDDGRIWTTKYLRVVDAYGVFEKHYGHAKAEHVTCTAEHVVREEDGSRYSSTWTVWLVPAG